MGTKAHHKETTKTTTKETTKTTTKVHLKDTTKTTTMVHHKDTTKTTTMVHHKDTTKIRIKVQKCLKVHMEAEAHPLEYLMPMLCKDINKERHITNNKLAT